jgi:4-hydroxy-tetrahydrodipicolinate synthase
MRMVDRFELKGIYTPVITPFHDDLTPDFESLAVVVDHLVTAGVHGLIAGGSTGESYAETVEERLLIARFVVERVQRRLPVFVGTGAMRTPDSIAIAKGARDMGADGLLLGTPPYSVPADHPVQLSRPHGRIDGTGVSGQSGAVEELCRDQGKLWRYQ